jgi:hypothetical protein
MDSDEVQRLVREDVLDGLSRRRDDDEPDGFDRDELERGFRFLDGRREGLPVLVGDVAGVAAWRIEATHDERVQGIPPTHHEVEITGCTYVLTGEDPPQFVRFVDWASALAQMGVTFNTKPLVDLE